MESSKRHPWNFLTPKMPMMCSCAEEKYKEENDFSWRGGVGQIERRVNRCKEIEINRKKKCSGTVNHRTKHDSTQD